jgi:hypothetical protein
LSLIALSAQAVYHLRLYLILTIPLNQYDTFVKKIDIPSPAYEELPHGAGRARASDVLSDVGGNIGVDVVRQIEKHFGLPAIAHDVHDAFVVVALGLTLEDAL